MNWNETHISHIVADFAEENAFACRALFRVTGIRYTSGIPSLAVTLADRPELLFNREFINSYAETENDIKALLMHEFLHVLLLHTEKFKINTPLLNIALDAIVNAIIHRTYGEAYSGFFARFYPWEGTAKLLRPNPRDFNPLPGDSFDLMHGEIYRGRFSGEDLHELLNFLLPVRLRKDGDLIFIGNHDSERAVISPENGTLLEGILRRMDGTGIWNKPGMRGTGGKLSDESAAVVRFRLDRWKEGVRRILTECLSPDPKRKILSDGEVALL
ncbi:MAG TPA: hypothetical protein P5219_12070, partial [Aminivibrio sp.]|nr:hypothetical protein [Aminivibrio sp.]